MQSCWIIVIEINLQCDAREGDSVIGRNRCPEVICWEELRLYRHRPRRWWFFLGSVWFDFFFFFMFFFPSDLLFFPSIFFFFSPVRSRTFIL